MRSRVPSVLRVVALVLACAMALMLAGCKRGKPPPLAMRMWFGPGGGCVETKAHPTIGTLACWGTNEAGEIGDGTTSPRPFATTHAFKEGKLTELARGPRHVCGVFDGQTAYCWGDGARGQLGSDATSSKVPVAVRAGGLEGTKDLRIAVGGAHTCMRWGARDRLRCFGAADEGQLGAMSALAATDDWHIDGLEIRAFALGDAHTCVAYGGSPGREHVQCRGRAAAAPAERLLEGVAVTALTAGAEHTCAQLEDHSVRCWGRNDAGQLGDGTTNDTKTPVALLDLRGVDGVAAGARHTCGRLLNGTVACWGGNALHQLASGTTERSTHPVVIVGVLGVQQIAAGGDATCARLGDGFVRCWGSNDRAQLGDGSTVEHSVPMPIRYR